MRQNLVNRLSAGIKAAESANDATFFSICQLQIGIKQMKKRGVTDSALEHNVSYAMQRVEELQSVLKIIHDDAEEKRKILGWSEPDSESGGGGNKGGG